jgi:hypothetical protein
MGGLRAALIRAAGVGIALRLLVVLVGIDEVAVAVFVMMAEPGPAEGQTIFVAALGDEIEEVIRAVQNIDSSPECGIGMKDFGRRVRGPILEKDADTWSFVGGNFSMV